jgi:hypothetical protein
VTDGFWTAFFRGARLAEEPAARPASGATSDPARG